MSEDNILAKPGSQGSGSKKTTSLKPPEQTLKCPRCDSPNTKFCYYNNYSLTQPRHFCKTCRRYWTKGGALRNVPIGGGCRKSKKSKPSSSSFSGDSKDSSGSLKFFHGLSPAMDFQLGGGGSGSGALSFPTRGYSYNQFPLASSTPCFATDTLGNSSTTFMGLNFPLLKQAEVGGFGQEIGGQSGTIASSIESLSSMNQDLHWKLQQQRLAMLFGGGETNQKENSGISLQKPQPIMFQNLEISKPDGGCDQVGGSSDASSRKEGAIGNLATEWYFESSSYGAPHVNPPSTSNVVLSNGNESKNNWSSAMQNWNELNQYSGFP